MIRSVLSLALATLAVGCASDDPKLRTYANNDLELVVGNAAKMTCTCIFVMEMGERYCTEWVRASPDIGTFSIDYGGKRVVSAAFVSWSATARFVDEKRGCVLE